MARYTGPSGAKERVPLSRDQCHPSQFHHCIVQPAYHPRATDDSVQGHDSCTFIQIPRLSESIVGCYSTLVHKSIFLGALLGISACGGLTDEGAKGPAVGGTQSSTNGTTGGNGGSPGATTTTVTNSGGAFVGGTTDLTPDQYSSLTSDACSGQTMPSGACVFAVPSYPLERLGATVTSFDVIRLVNGTSDIPVLINETYSTCPEGQGWYLDSNGQIALCEATCTNLHEDMTPTIVVYLHCLAKGGPN